MDTAFVERDKGLRLDAPPPPAIEKPAPRSDITAAYSAKYLGKVTFSWSSGVTRYSSDDGSAYQAEVVASATESRGPAATYAERTNRDRLVLLAKKFAMRTLTDEQEARLLIATERVDRLFPRYGDEDFAGLEAMEKSVEELKSRMASRGILDP